MAEGRSYNDHNSAVRRVGSGLAMCGSLPPGPDTSTTRHSMVYVSNSQQPAGLCPALCPPVWSLFNFGYLPAAGAVVDGPGIRSETLKNNVDSGRSFHGHQQNTRSLLELSTGKTSDVSWPLFTSRLHLK